MKTVLAMAAVASLTAGVAAAALSPQLSRPAATPVVEISREALVDEILRTVLTVREARDGSSAEAAELEISAALEGLIIESGASPETVLAALTTAMARKQCTILENGRYDKPGCGALAAIRSTVATALGGPAALGRTGNQPMTPAGPPPSGSGGSDYSN